MTLEQLLASDHKLVVPFIMDHNQQLVQNTIKGKSPLRVQEGAMHPRAGSSAQSIGHVLSSGTFAGHTIGNLVNCSTSRRNADEADLVPRDTSQSKRPRVDSALQQDLIGRSGWVETDPAISPAEWRKQLFAHLKRHNSERPTSPP